MINRDSMRLQSFLFLIECPHSTFTGISSSKNMDLFWSFLISAQNIILWVAKAGVPAFVSCLPFVSCLSFFSQFACFVRR